MLCAAWMAGWTCVARSERRAARVGRASHRSPGACCPGTNQLQQELADEGASPPLQLGAATLDRAIVARLIEAPPSSYPQPPLHYLLGCYGRASDALRSAGGGRGDAAERARLVEVVSEARAQLVQYAVLLLSGSGVVPEVGRGGALCGAVPCVWRGKRPDECMQLMARARNPWEPSCALPSHPQPPKAAERGAAQLADALIAANGGRCEPGVVPLPPGFLDELAAKCDSLDVVLQPVGASGRVWDVHVRFSGVWRRATRQHGGRAGHGPPTWTQKQLAALVSLFGGGMPWMTSLLPPADALASQCGSLPPRSSPARRWGTTRRRWPRCGSWCRWSPSPRYSPWVVLYSSGRLP